MGIDNSAFEFLFKNRVPDLGETLWLGRQSLNVNTGDQRFMTKLPAFGLSKEDADQIFSGVYADAVFHYLGATSIRALDMSPFEGADLIHDLNVPISAEFYNKFDCIFDGGTLEHVFNFPVAIESVKRMLKVGGIFISINGANDMLGHGLYQFSPELMWRVFSREAGFQVLTMQLVAQDGWAPPIEAIDPQAAGKRIEISMTQFPTYIMLIAHKERDVSDCGVYQSDYKAAWDKV
jgi:SAM-dependent methyltransferase